MSRKNRKPERRNSRFDTEATAELKQILDAARAMTANGAEPRKHHLVPKFYLERWAEDDRVRVTDLDSNQKTYLVAPSKALRETDYYRLPEGTVKDGSPVVWEAWLSKREGEAAAVFQAVDSVGLDGLDRGQWAELLSFIGIQMTRSRAFRYKGRWMSGPGQYRLLELDQPGAIEALLTRIGEEPTPERVAEVADYFNKVKTDPWSVPMDPGFEMDTSIRAARGMAETLATRQFRLIEASKPLMTCDEPIVELYEDMRMPSPPLGGGVHGAPIIVFPFGPNQVLAMFRSNMPVSRIAARLSAAETLELNRAIAGNAHRHLVERPSTCLGSRLFIPEFKGEPIRIVNIRRSDVVWTQTQRRWHGCSIGPTRPVSSWWPAVLPPPPPIPATEDDWDREREAYER